MKASFFGYKSSVKRLVTDIVIKKTEVLIPEKAIKLQSFHCHRYLQLFVLIALKEEIFSVSRLKKYKQLYRTRLSS